MVPSRQTHDLLPGTRLGWAVSGIDRGMDSHSNLRETYSRLDVPWVDDEEAFAKWLLARNPNFFERSLPFIGYLEFLPNMRNCLIATLLVCVLGGSALASEPDGQVAGYGAEVTASILGNPTTSDCWMKLYVKNCSLETFVVAGPAAINQRAAPMFELAIFGPEGKKCPLSFAGNTIYHSLHDSYTPLLILAGMSHEWIVPLHEQFNLKPGDQRLVMLVTMGARDPFPEVPLLLADSVASRRELAIPLPQHPMRATDANPRSSRKHSEDPFQPAPINPDDLKIGAWDSLLLPIYAAFRAPFNHLAESHTISLSFKLNE